MANRLDVRACVILAILTASELTMGCHTAYHVEDRRKRYASNVLDSDGEIGLFFTDCLGDITTETWDWRSLVDYVVKYSIWFEKTEAQTCSPALGLDTPACWKNQVPELLQPNSPLIQPIRACVDGFSTFKNLMYATSGGMDVSSSISSLLSSSVSSSIASSLASPYSRSDPTNSDDNKCPIKHDNRYEDCITDVLTTKVGYNSFTVASLSSLSSFMEEEADCTESCECTDLFSGAQDALDWYDRKGISCNDCWATRLASVTRNGDSAITYALEKCAQNQNNYTHF